MKIRLSEEDIEIFKLTAIGRAYLEYNEKIGGKAFGYSVGMPVKAVEVIDQLGGLAEMYGECIRREITWEELLQWDGHSDELPTKEPQNGSGQL